MPRRIDPMPKMNAAVKAQWLRALRSGEWTQITEILGDTGKGRCCLGVLADVCGVGWHQVKGDPQIESGNLRNDHRYYEFVGGDRDQLPTPEFAESVGLSHRHLQHLAGMNDEGQSFEEIATHIENNY